MDAKYLEAHNDLRDSEGVLQGPFTLEAMQEAYTLLGSPLYHTPTFLVAGTNGKGSVCGMLYSILQNHGLSVGLYTSPHLLVFEDRAQYSHAGIGKYDLYDQLLYIKAFLPEHLYLQLSVFERITLCSFLALAHHSPQVVVVEVGLGGDRDATNVLDPEVSVIVSIGYDHQHILGGSLRGIASEKAGIRRANRPLVLGDGCLKKELEEYLQSIPFISCSQATKTQLQEYIERYGWPSYMPLGLQQGKAGRKKEGKLLDVQTSVMIDNLALSLEAFFAYHQAPVCLYDLLAPVPKSLPITFRGRGEVVKCVAGEVWVDVAHNVEAMQHAFCSFKFYKAKNTPSSQNQKDKDAALLSLLCDKDPVEILHLALQHFAKIFLYPVNARSYMLDSAYRREALARELRVLVGCGGEDMFARVIWLDSFGQAYAQFCDYLKAEGLRVGYLGGCFAAVRKILTHV